MVSVVIVSWVSIGCVKCIIFLVFSVRWLMVGWLSICVFC